MFQYLIVGCYPDCIPAIDGPQGRDVFLMGIYHNHVTLYLMYLIYLMHINMCIYIHIHIHLPMTIPIIPPDLHPISCSAAPSASAFLIHLAPHRAASPSAMGSGVSAEMLANSSQEEVPRLDVTEALLMVVTGWWFGTFGLFFHILGIRIPTD